MKRICVFPGSFDPVTEGHMDLIRRAAGLFDEVIVAVMHHPKKAGSFTPEERVALITKSCAGITNVRAATSEGLTVMFCRKVGACAMIRGLRNMSDFDQEQQLAQANARIAPEIETVFLACRPEHSMISSSCVREMASYGCDLTGMVPEAILADVRDRFSTVSHRD